MANPLSFLWRRKSAPQSPTVAAPVSADEYPQGFFWLVGTSGARSLAFYCRQCRTHFRGVQPSSAIAHCARLDKPPKITALLPQHKVRNPKMPTFGGHAFLDTEEMQAWSGEVTWTGSKPGGVSFR
jgi:hypothetical protein